MLENSRPLTGYDAGKAEICKPNYEDIIKRVSMELIRTKNFRNAALAYFKGQAVQGDAAELIGELVTKCIQLQDEKDSLIAQQEANSE